MFEQTDRYQRVRWISLLGACVNAMLGIIKLIFGWLGNSHALVADGVHSLSDLITDALVIFASSYGSEAADSEHPYGHERIETAATMFLSMILILAGAGIIVDAANHVWTHATDVPSPYVLIIALISILANEALYHYTLRVAKVIKSELLRANAWHHRSDAAASIVVLIGVAGSLLGFHYLDAAAALVVGMMVVKMGGSLGWSSIRELIDTGVDAKTLQEIHTIIAETPGVVSVHQLRTRSMGGRILVDVHILVSPKLSVSEGHHIGQCVHFALVDGISEVSDVTVHIDPEDDEIEPPSRHLPFRDKIISALRDRWRDLPISDFIEDIMLHYLHGEIHVDVVLSLRLLDKGLTPTVIRQQMVSAMTDLPEITALKVYYG